MLRLAHFRHGAENRLVIGHGKIERGYFFGRRFKVGIRGKDGPKDGAFRFDIRWQWPFQCLHRFR